jgi:hypothetical protein
VKNMTDCDFNHDKDLDRELDAALAQYAAVEPRAGLEERIFANLEAEWGGDPGARRWGWPAAAVLAAALVVLTVAFLWKLESGPRTTARHTPTATQKGGITQVADNGNVAQVHHAHAAARKSHRAPALSPVDAVPRLDQFPSPRPLSEQEKILASYVANYPQNAALLAELHAEALRQDLADDDAKHRAALAGDSPQ